MRFDRFTLKDWRPGPRQRAGAVAALVSIFLTLAANAISREKPRKIPDMRHCPMGIVGERALREAPLTWYPIPARCIAPDVLERAGVMWLQ